LTVYKEFPIVIQNHLRLPGQKGAAYYLDYYIPELKLAIELDSELHKLDKDTIRDQYLSEKLGIKTIRIKNLEKESVQKTRFRELAAEMRGMTVNKNPEPFCFLDNIRRTKGI
jgi:very-short-patch-repair endonuclease